MGGGKERELIRPPAKSPARPSHTGVDIRNHPILFFHGTEMLLVALTPGGVPAGEIEDVPEIARDVIQSTADMYRVSGYQPPRIGYLAVDGARCVGACAFKTARVDGRVETACFTFPGNEGRGAATRMAESLIATAREQVPPITVYARTLPEPSASTRVLEKLGFHMIGLVEHPEDGMVLEWVLASQQGIGVKETPRLGDTR